LAEPRRVGPGEAELVIGIVRKAYGPQTGGLFLRWLVREGVGPVVVVDDLAVAAGVAFGPAGWIGGVGVAAEARRQGLGTAVTQALIAELRRAGCQTMLLLASELGYPVYERIGFEREGDYVVGHRAGEPPAAPALGPGDLQRAAALDRWATGSDRSVLLAHARTGIVEHDAYGLVTPWRDRPAVARDPAGGVRLLEALRPPRVTVPAANDPAVRWLHRNGYTFDMPTPRMRLGPPLPWRPETIFGAISLLSA
jgi:GNAT superfamily N-acetyltransferase